jgi:predicted ATPase
LPSPERATLQAASVIGRRFPFRVLDAIAGANGDLSEHLLRLQQADLVRERARLPELEYIFKHHMVQEVTYGTLLQDQRAELHGKVADLLMSLYPERLDELHGALGRHFSAAGDRERALRHYKRAARRAEQVFAYDEATHHLQHALALLDLDHAISDRIRLLEDLADARGYLAEQVAAVSLYQEAIDLWHSLDAGDKWVHVRLLRKIGDAVASMQLLDERSRHDDMAFELLDRASEETQGEPPHPEMVRVLLAKFKLETRHVASRLNWDAAAVAAHSAVEIAEQLDDLELLAAALDPFESLHFNQGNINEQVKTGLRRLELIQGLESVDIRSEASVLLGAGVALKNAGKFKEALEHLWQAEVRAREIQATLMQASALGARIECLFRLDRWDEVLDLEIEQQDLHKRYGIARAGPICFSISFSASVHALRGELVEAKELREEAYDIMTTAGSGSEDEWVRNQHF